MRVFVEEQGVPAHLEIDDHDQAAVHWLAYQDGQAVATARLVRYSDHQGKVGRVAVLPDWRSAGWGREVMNEIHRWAGDQPFQEIILDAQVEVIAFYEKLGYQAQGEVFEDCGILHRRMVRWLA